MDKLTLDTNVLRDWAWAEGRTLETRYHYDEQKRNELKYLFKNLQQFRDHSLCEIGITNQLFTDYEKDMDDLPSFIKEMIGPYVNFATPSISTFPIIFPFVFADENEIDQILRDVFPNSHPGHKKYERNEKDALQLYAHMVSDRDIFLTSDKSILSAREKLLRKWHICVMNLEEYVLTRIH